MYEEHGYQRSGKKCREKFENLYKYYKKTKEGKAGRQDGKHYRFFRQLEALYGETSSSNQASLVPEPHFVGNINLGFHNATNTSSTHQAINQEELLQSQKLCDSLSLSNSSSGFDTSSSEENERSTATLAENDSTEKRSRKRRGGKSWKAKIKDFIDSQMRRLIRKQEAWLERLTRTLEQKEQERMLREEDWRKKEAARIDKEHKFWAKEREWIEARDAALMEALQKLRGKEAPMNASSPDHQHGLMRGGSSTPRIRSQSENQNEECNDKINNNTVKSDHNSWLEFEVTRLIELRTSMEPSFQQLQSSTGGFNEEVLWEEIAAKMACLGYERSASECKNKWDSISYYSRKRKENPIRSIVYFQSTDCTSTYKNSGGAYRTEINEQGGTETLRLQSNDHVFSTSPAHSNNAGNVVAASSTENCFRFLIGEGESNLWENYGFKQLNKGDHHHHP